MEEKKKYIRQVALKTTINQIILGTYVQEEDQDIPNYLLSIEQNKIYRINLMCIIYHFEKQGTITNLLIDDGTGKIIVRFFEENKIIEKLKIGDSILIIGKIRSYNQEKYISPEIIKKINPYWLRVRVLELKNNLKLEEKKVIIKELEENLNKDNKKKNDKKEEIVLNNLKKENFEINKIIEEDNLLPVQKLLNLIKKLDKGEGVLIEEIINKSMLENTEEIIDKMIKNGDIFQNLPGKVKVL